MQMDASHESTADPDKVWAVLSDIDGSPETISGITAVERLDSGTDFAIGTKWKETRVMFGRESSEVMEVTAIEPGRSYTVVSDGKGATYTSIMAVEPVEGGSTISMSFGGEPTSTVSRVMSATLGRLAAGSMRKMIEQDLKDIAAAAEG